MGLQFEFIDPLKEHGKLRKDDRDNIILLTNIIRQEFLQHTEI